MKKILNKLEKIQEFIDIQGSIHKKYSDFDALSFVQEDLTKLKELIECVKSRKSDGGKNG